MQMEKDYYKGLLRSVKNYYAEEVFEEVKSNEMSDILSVDCHLEFFEKILDKYKEKRRTESKFLISICEEGMSAYLKYILQRQFQDCSQLEEATRVYEKDLIRIGGTLISMKSSCLNNVLLEGIFKNLDPSLRLDFFKQLLIWTSNSVDSDSYPIIIRPLAYTSLFQSFIKMCPDDFDFEEMSVLYKLRTFKKWKWQFFLTPIHAVLLGNIKDKDEIHRIMNNFYNNIIDDDDNLFALDPIVAIDQLLELMKCTRFIPKHRISNNEEINLKRYIINWIREIFFPGQSVPDILRKLIDLEDCEAFEVFLYFSEPFQVSPEQLKYFTLKSLRIASDSKNVRHFEFLLIILAYFDLEPSDFLHDPKEQRTVFNHIVRELLAVVKSLPVEHLKMGISVPNDSDGIIKLKGPEPIVIPEVICKQYDGYPVYFYAARIILQRLFNVPLIATRIYDFANDQPEWSEAVGYINFYLERFAALEGIGDHYKVVEIEEKDFETTF